jgi:basic amino acid/polyamine antiporter, APA family
MASHLFATKSLKQLLEEMAGEERLHRVLGPVQLTSLGVGAVIGTGIFILTGQAAHDKAGPALILSFVVAGLACVFAALCYAEFAAMAPVAGSAYTYAYATLGELFAWIIGWDLVLEYAVASSVVAHGWSAHFQELIHLFNWSVPHVFATAPFDYQPDVGRIVTTGAYFDLPAIVIAFIVTAILVKGIKESASINTGIVIVKLAIVVFVIVVGAFYIDPRNWTDNFAPYGFTGISFFGKTLWGQTGAGGEPLGMFAGAAIIFFAYIGFDSVSTHAEEAKRPSRDVPIGIVASLLICTVLYILVSAVLTGMVPYKDISVDAPVVDAFKRQGLTAAQYLVAAGALAGITSVLLVMMLSQPRVLLAMARDGLLPRSFFGAVHPRFRTPWKSTILTGIFVAVLAAFVPLRIMAEMTNIGTLLAFVIVCAAVLIMRRINPHAERPFKAPLYPLVPILGILTCLLLMFSLPVENWWRLFVWMALGFIIYFMYGYKHSDLRLKSEASLAAAGGSRRR